MYNDKNVKAQTLWLHRVLYYSWYGTGQALLLLPKDLSLMWLEGWFSFCRNPVSQMKCIFWLLTWLPWLATRATQDFAIKIIQDLQLSSDETIVSFHVTSLFMCIPTNEALLAMGRRLLLDTTLQDRTASPQTTFAVYFKHYLFPVQRNYLLAKTRLWNWITSPSDCG